MRLSICELCERPIRGDYEIVAGDVVCRACLESEIVLASDSPGPTAGDKPGWTPGDR